MFYLLKRGKIYHVRLWVPLDIRCILGRRELKKSLKTSNKREAKIAAKVLSARAEKFYLRARAGVMTDRELEVLAGELISEFTGRIDEHRKARKKPMEFMLDGFPPGLDPSYDLHTVSETFRYVKSLDDVNKLVGMYSARVERLEEEQQTGNYSDFTRRLARRIINEKGLDVRLPSPKWFDENEPEWFDEPPTEFGRVCDTVVSALIAMYSVEEERVRNKRDTPLQREVLAKAESAKPRPKLSDLWKEHHTEYVSRNRWVSGTARKNKTAYDTAVQILGDRELVDYTDADAHLLIENLKKKGNEVGHITYVLGLLSTLWKRALKRPKIWLAEYNPWAEKQPRDTRAECEKKLPYSQAEIEGMFRGLNLERRQVEPEKFWGPLIAMYTGMRLNEVSQLRVEDIADVDGTWTFHICHKPELNQTTKNRKNRTCPVHPTLKKIGFLHYLEERKKSGAERLFENVFLYEGKWKKKIGDWYNRTFEPAHVSKAKEKSFHSTRHTFINWFVQNVELTFTSLSVLKSMVGHLDKTDLSILANAGGITQDVYSDTYPPMKQFGLLKKLDYGVDAGLLERKRG